MQVHRRRKDLEQLPDRDQDRVAGERQQGEGRDEAGGQHQRAQPARRSTPPGDQPAHQVRDGDPADHQHSDGRVRQLSAGRGQDAETGDHGGARQSGEPQRPGGRPRSRRPDRRAVRAPRAHFSGLDTGVPPRGIGGQPPPLSLTVPSDHLGRQTRNPNHICTGSYDCRRTAPRPQWNRADFGPQRKAVDGSQSAVQRHGEKRRRRRPAP